MTNSEKRRQYFKKYYQSHKEQCLERYRRNYQRRKELGIVTGDVDIYHTREELQEAETREEGRINWDMWDKAVEQAKNDITNALKDYQGYKKRKPIYVYTINAKIPLFIFENSDEASKTLGINRMVITNQCRTERPYHQKGIIMLYHPINLNEIED